MKRLRRCWPLYVSLLAAGGQQAGGGNEPAIDFGREIRYFGGSPYGHPWPKYELLRDLENNRILNLALGGVTRAQLDEAGMRDAEQRLAALVEGQCLRREGSIYRVAFPVLRGKDREEIRSLVDAAVKPVVGGVAEMAARLKRAARGREDAHFHLLWSRAMDKFWYPAWKAATGDKNGAPAAAWVLRPDHRLQTGTNYHNLPGDGEIAVTWSSRASNHIERIMAVRARLAYLAWGLAAPADQEAAREAGCVDEGGRLRAFVLRRGDAMDKLTARIAREYGALAAKLFDYRALAPRFGVTPGQLFAILQHEAAYAIYDALAARGALEIPPALLQEGDPDACARLVSLRLKQRPERR